MDSSPVRELSRISLPKTAQPDSSPPQMHFRANESSSPLRLPRDLSRPSSRGSQRSIERAHMTKHSPPDGGAWWNAPTRAQTGEPVLGASNAEVANDEDMENEHEAHEDDYTLDLSALPGPNVVHDTHHDTMEEQEAVEAAETQQQLDQVRSEDIDGPSDFTVNLEAWMRGEMQRGQKKPVGGTRRTLKRGVSRGTLRSNALASALARSQSAALSKQADTSGVEEQEHEKDVMMSRSQRARSDAREEDDLIAPTPLAVQDSSIWQDAYGPTSPSPVLKKVLSGSNMLKERFAHLQPTVEDYDSELGTPDVIRPLMPVPNLSHQNAPQEGDRSEHQVSPSPTPVPEKTTARNGLAELEHEHDELLQRLDLLQEQNGQLAARAQQAEAQARNLETKRLETQARLNALHDEAETAQRKLQTAQCELQEARMQVAEMRESEDAEMHELRERIKVGAQREVELQSEVDTLRADATARTTAVTSLPPATANRDLAEAQREIEDLKEELAVLRDLSLLADDNDTAPQPGEAEIQLRNDLDLMTRERDSARQAAQQHETQVEKLSHDLAQARAAPVQAAPRPDPAAEERLRGSEGKRLELHAQLDAMRAELQDLRDANRDTDAKIAGSFRKREERWAAMQKAWEDERAVMVKALMRQWGKEEVGHDAEVKAQRYRYKYVDGSGQRRAVDLAI